MGEVLFLEATCLRESFITLVTLKHLLSCVWEVVSLQVTCLRESFVALVAGKHLLSCMGELVCFEIMCQRKWFVTLSADKQLFSCMGDLKDKSILKKQCHQVVRILSLRHKVQMILFYNICAFSKWLVTFFPQELLMLPPWELWGGTDRKTNTHTRT